jgi:hypothetical protein
MIAHTKAILDKGRISGPPEEVSLTETDLPLTLAKYNAVCLL